jgi:hypothetical protein
MDFEKILFLDFKILNSTYRSDKKRPGLLVRRKLLKLVYENVTDGGKGDDNRKKADKSQEKRNLAARNISEQLFECDFVSSGTKCCEKHWNEELKLIREAKTRIF